MIEDEKSEAELLSAIMENSEFVQDEDLPPVPEPDQAEEEVEEDQEELEEDLEEEETEEVEEDSEEEEEVEEEADEGEEPVEELLDEDEVDWDYKVPVTIDGETQHLSLEEIRKGYATQQHLSNQGRELGEARKQIEAERTERLDALVQMTEGVNSMLGQQEQYLAQQYHNIDQQIEEARKDGDQYKVQELKDQREVAQQNYWNARQQREGILQQVAQQHQQVNTESWNQQVQQFYDGIVEVIPDYNQDYAEQLRAFGQEEGISEEYMLTITDPTIVKVLDDYRKLKNGVSTGAKKRAKAPVKKAPKKKQATAAQKKASKKNMTKARAFREDASKDDQDAFLRQYAERSLGFED